MSTTPISTDRATRVPTAGVVDANLEVVVIPVADVERAKRFYASLGWRLDADFASGECSSRRRARSAPSNSERE